MLKKMNNRILLIIFFSFLCNFIITFDSHSLTVSPFLLDIETEKGKIGSEKIKLINDSDSEQEIKVTLVDVEFDKKGNKIMRPPGTLKNSIAQYVKITPEKLILKAQESKEVVLSIDVPETSVGGKYCIAYFESLPVVVGKNQKKMSLGVKLGVVVLQKTKGTVITKSRIVSIDIDQPSESKPLVMKLTIINQGNAHIKASATAAIMTEDDNFIGRIDFTNGYLVQNITKTLTGEFGGNIQPGKYHALITYEYAEDKNIVIDKHFEIK